MKYVCLSVTSECNMNCDYCYRIEAKRPYITFEDFLKITKKLKQIGTEEVTITGGEPLLHPFISQIIEICVKEGFIVNLGTNALLLDINNSVYHKISCISIGCDGIESFSTGNESRSKIQLDKCIEILSLYRKRRYPFQLKVNTVVTRSNIDYLVEFGKKYLNYPDLMWLLFRYCDKGTYNSMPSEKVVTVDEMDKLIKSLREASLKTTILYNRVERSIQKTSKYYIINSDGNVYLSTADDNIYLGNIIYDDISLFSSLEDLRR